MAKVKTLSKKPTVARRFEEDWALASAKIEHVRKKMDDIGDIDSRDITNTDLFLLHSCMAGLNRIMETLNEIEGKAM